MLEREHLSATGRASASECVPSPTKWSVGSVFLFQLLLEQVDQENVLYAEHSRVTG